MISPEFGNAPALLVSWLRDELELRSDEVLAGVIVGGTVPPKRDHLSAPPLVVVRRSGGIATWPVLDRPRLDFLHWHKTEFQATALANITRELLLYGLRGSIVDDHTIYQPVEFAGPGLYPDPAGSDVSVVMYSLEVPIRVRSRTHESS
jgi:hypothetical protein